MKYNPAIHNRRSVRLKQYDYSQQSAYFITIFCNDRALPSNNIGAMVRGYKSAVTKQINILDSGMYNRTSTVWKRSFYEHIIRKKKSYQHISDYIVNNPLKWNADTFHKS